MAATYEFYIARAKEAAAAAKEAELENVRERELRSEKTWRGLAKQAQAVAAQRAKVDQEKADRQAAEKALITDEVGE